MGFNSAIYSPLGGRYPSTGINTGFGYGPQFPLPGINTGLGYGGVNYPYSGGVYGYNSFPTAAVPYAGANNGISPGLMIALALMPLITSGLSTLIGSIFGGGQDGCGCGSGNQYAFNNGANGFNQGTQIGIQGQYGGNFYNGYGNNFDPGYGDLGVGFENY